MATKYWIGGTAGGGCTPYDPQVAQNWSDGSIPVTGDIVILDDKALGGIQGDLSQSVTVPIYLDEFRVTSRFVGRIGTSSSPDNGCGSLKINAKSTSVHRRCDVGHSSTNSQNNMYIEFVYESGNPNTIAVFTGGVYRDLKITGELETLKIRGEAINEWDEFWTKASAEDLGYITGNIEIGNTKLADSGYIRPSAAKHIIIEGGWQGGPGTSDENRQVIICSDADLETLPSETIATRLETLTVATEQGVKVYTHAPYYGDVEIRHAKEKANCPDTCYSPNYITFLPTDNFLADPAFQAISQNTDGSLTIGDSPTVGSSANQLKVRRLETFLDPYDPDTRVWSGLTNSCMEGFYIGASTEARSVVMTWQTPIEITKLVHMGGILCLASYVEYDNAEVAITSGHIGGQAVIVASHGTIPAIQSMKKISDACQIYFNLAKHVGSAITCKLQSGPDSFNT